MRLFRFWRSNENNNHNVRGSPPNVEHSTPESEQLLSTERTEESESGLAMSSPDGNGTAESVTLDCRDSGEPEPPKPDIYAPPPYEEVANDQDLLEDHQLLPATLHVSPPTYEEVQRLKAIEAGTDPIPHPNESASNGVRVVRMNSMGDLESLSTENQEEPLLGTDLMFFAAFTGAFLFNFVGIVLLLCLCHTIAGRTGAMAGFGLSLAKWVFIFRNSPDLIKDSNAWLLWLMMVLGLLIFARSILQYVTAKREWRNGGQNGQQRQRFFVMY